MKAAPAPRSRSSFPDPAQAGAEGLVAVGGDLAPGRLIDAYSHGIFPWFNRDSEPVLWWSPDPRAVIPLAGAGRGATGGFHVSRRLRRRLRAGVFEITVDRAFDDVVAGCAAPRGDDGGTWITLAMRRAYGTLHRDGIAHSVEVWQGQDLAGGVYGASLGGMFFAESMFSAATDASKAALAYLARQLCAWDFDLLDCQLMTDHLASLGAVAMPRAQFLERVRGNRDRPTRVGAWDF